MDFDLLPAKDPRAKRSRSRNRKRLVAGGLTALAVIAGIAGFITLSGGDDADGSRQATATSKPNSARNRPDQEAADDSSTSSTSTSTDSGPPEVEIAEPEVTESTVPPPPNDEQIIGNISMQENLCDWDAGTATLRSAGTLINDNEDGHLLELSVFWYASDGFELNGAGGEFFADGGGEPLDWELTNSLDEAPVGLRCEATFTVVN